MSSLEGGADASAGVGADAVIVAAGSSTRMGGIDKLAAPLGGRPVLAWTVDALASVGLVERIVVVTAADRVDGLRDAAWLSPKVVAVVPGGDRRQVSVAAGVAALPDLGRDTRERVVLVHDGARPAVSPSLVEAVALAAAVHGAALPVLPVPETVKRIADGVVVETVDRSVLATAQTPQGVRRGLLEDAYGRFAPSAERTFTDEAALLEACSIPVHVIRGDPANIKVTTPADLGRVAGSLGSTAGAMATGIGHDSHPFGPGAPLALGGITIPGAPRLHGHSDGDVALHAVCDALLGAAALGDLGRLFPAGPATPRGIASLDLLDEVLRRLDGAGVRPSGVDLTIVGARPRLGSFLDAMRDVIAARLRLAPGQVNVKASTGNLDGMEGAGRGMSALAIATVQPRP